MVIAMQYSYSRFIRYDSDVTCSTAQITSTDPVAHKKMLATTRKSSFCCCAAFAHRGTMFSSLLLLLFD